MAAGLFRFTVATDDRILRKIAFGFLVVTVPPAARVQGHAELSALTPAHRRLLGPGHAAWLKLHRQTGHRRQLAVTEQTDIRPDR
jgi:hypothetical protein